MEWVMVRKKKKVRWIDRLTDAAKTIADGAARSGQKSKDKGRQKANCGGCD